MERMIEAARGRIPADTTYTGGVLFNPFTCSWEETAFAVRDGIVVGLGEYEAEKTVDLGGARVVPGLIDAHVHMEARSSPHAYMRGANRDRANNA